MYKRKYKRTNSNLQNTTKKTKNRETPVSKLRISDLDTRVTHAILIEYCPGFFLSIFRSYHLVCEFPNI